MNVLTLDLNTKSTIPLYEQIYQYIKMNIQNKRISFGEKLPSTRALARHLEVSRSTIELAYEQLLSEGYIEAEAYRGYYVTQIEGLHQFESKKLISIPKVRMESIHYQYDFTPHGIDLNSFPYGVWRKLSKEILLDDKMEIFRLGNSQGEQTLRETICDYLHQSRGVKCRPEQMIVGAGNDYMLMLLSSILGEKHRIAFESPTYKQAYKLFKNLSHDVCTVNMDKYGMNVEKLKESKAELAYVMPSHQYPLGVIMPMKRRIELLKWASERKKDRYIIEDDYDSEFRYKGKPIPALQGSDSNQKVIYLGTFSKAIAPAIRMSYMVLPESLLSVYQEKNKFLSSTVSKVDQFIVERFIKEGYYERHLNKMRALYKSRHDKLISCLKPLTSKCSISGEHAGVHLLLTFYDGRTEAELIKRASDKQIKVYGLSGYYTEPEQKGNATILLGYANLTETQIGEAISLLCEVW